VTTIDDLITLIRDEMGLSVTQDDADLPLDQVAGWDSLHLLSLMTLLERRTARSVPFVDLVEAGSLREILDLAVAA
jgi:acyl carrier protein